MQQRRPSPLFSRLGCGSALIFVAILGSILYLTGPGLFSPGALSASNSGEAFIGGFQSHAEIEKNCGLCHTAFDGASAELCQDCHITIARERENGVGLHGKLSDTGRCFDCHTDHNGREAEMTLIDLVGFRHDSLTNFSLAHHEFDYSGNRIACSDCHLDQRFDAGRIDCISCHMDADSVFMEDHIGLFGRECLRCHDGLDRMSDFVHDEIFPLDGAHAALSCDSCHNQQLLIAEARECLDCHREPEVHFGLFGTDCARCHETTAWTPALLTQHEFPIDHGGQGKIACETCHQENYIEYTCYGCHEHEIQETVEEHAEEGIFQIDDCVECHPTGREDEFED